MIVLLLLLCGSPSFATAQYFATSTRKMVELLKMEDNLLTHLNQYAEGLQRKVNMLNLILAEGETIKQQANGDPTSFLQNPVNSFSLFRRMHEDVPNLLNFLKAQVETDTVKAMSEVESSLINEEELSDAANDLLLIQNTYDLNERDMAKGLLHHKQYDARLSAADCLAMGNHSWSNLEQGHVAIEWFKLALERYDENLKPLELFLKSGREHILEHLGHVQYSTHDFTGSLASYNEIVKQGESSSVIERAEKKVTKIKKKFAHFKICQKNFPQAVDSSLRCYLNTKTTPFLRLAPLKLEQLSHDPYLVMYHDVIYKREASNLMYLAKMYLQRSRIRNKHSYSLRTSKETSFMIGPTSKLQLRMEDMTGFDLSEELVINAINYGLGGQYYVHEDCWFQDEINGNFNYTTGNRLATVIFYLTDIELGGITSFPLLNLGVIPKKGSALVWHNVDNAMDCDSRLSHGACPVLLGSRWIGVKWISPLHQWRTKPCLAK